MKISALSVSVLAVCLALTVFAYADEPQLRAEVMHFCAGVKDREPVGVSDTFPSDIVKIFCFTKIVGAPDTVSVAHVWYYGDKEMARVDLTVKSSSWRTWSSKKMVADWSGTWRVDVVESDTALIASKKFTLE